jgi:hypothetical protein
MENNFLKPNLIPRQREANNPLLDGLAFLAIFLVIASVVFAGYLQIVNRGFSVPFQKESIVKGLEKENQQLTDDLAKIPVDEQKDADSELRSKIKRISAFGELYRRHLMGANIFEFLKRSQMAEITVSSFKADLDRGAVVIDGKARDFIPAGQQFKVLQIDSDVESVNMESISLRGPDEVGFTFSIRLNPKAIKYIKQ